jgi:hypothetical protein
MLQRVQTILPYYRHLCRIFLATTPGQTLGPNEQVLVNPYLIHTRQVSLIKTPIFYAVATMADLLILSC